MTDEPTESLSVEEILDRIDEEGLGQTVVDGVDCKEIADPKLRLLWENARVALLDLQEYVDELTTTFSPDDDLEEVEETEVDLESEGDEDDEEKTKERVHIFEEDDEDDDIFDKHVHKHANY